jgi:hypothetical protein
MRLVTSVMSFGSINETKPTCQILQIIQPQHLSKGATFAKFWATFFMLRAPQFSVLPLFEGISCTSGCPWPKATLKSPVGARDLGPL